MKNHALMKIMLMLAVILLFSAASPAYAITQLEWNRTIYELVLVQQEGVAYTQFEYRPIGSLPPNTYIQIHSNDQDGYRKISYLQGGNQTFCYICTIPLTLANAYQYVDVISDGMVCAMKVPEAYLDDIDALREYVKKNGSPGCRLLEDSERDRLVWGRGDSLWLPEEIDGQGASSSSSTTSNKSTKVTRSSITAKPAATPEPAQDVTWNDSIVAIQQLGVVNSIVVLEGEPKEVATAELVFSADQSDDKHVAVIFAPNTGKCTLRVSGSDSGAAIKQCKAGTVVSVLKYGSKYTRISYNGEAGYVLTSCLKFYGKDAQTIGTGTIIYSKEKPNLKTTINIRNKTDKSSFKVAEWNTGTQVQVFAHLNGWYEVEYDGIHGYVMEQYLVMNE